ncbi:MAG: hypothetical protein IJF58_01115 [Clostridia bacterium]|nr:hypothetical protein [Clostridia bacterium]
MKKAKFWILITVYLILALSDGLLTYINTPDLSMEGNPLVSYFGLGWCALATANIIVFVLLFMAAYYSYCKYKTVYTNETKFTAYASQIVYDRPDMFFKGIIPKHITPIIACGGFALLYSSIISRAIIVFEWLCTTFDVTWADGYFNFRDIYCHGYLHVIVAAICMIVCMFYWLYKEFKKQLK